MLKKLFMVCAILALSACSKLTNDNFDKLEVGMSLQQVSQIIGNPDSCSDALGTKRCIWGDEQATYIKVSFIADNAATFSSNNLK